MEGLLILATEVGQKARFLMVGLRSAGSPRRRKSAKGGMGAQSSACACHRIPDGTGIGALLRSRGGYGVPALAGETGFRH